MDILRATAIVRVVLYHTLGFAWISFAFPAMGLMFALGGSLMAASVDRSGVSALGRRLRRILPPVWALGVVAVTAMWLMNNVRPTWRAVLWILPLDNPPFDDWGATWLGQIWYIRSYLWFILLTPVLLRLFRKSPIVAVLVPFVALLLIELVGRDRVEGVPRDFAMYAPAWMLGFAHHDGTLQRLSKRLLWAVAIPLAALGLTILFSHPGPRGFDLNDSPVADVLWGTAFLMVLLAYAPKALSLGPAQGFVEAVNRRALTIYLWHGGAITLATFGADLMGLDRTTHMGTTIIVLFVLAAIMFAVLAFGWIEDLGARRKLSLWPVPAAKPAVRVEAIPEAAVANA